MAKATLILSYRKLEASTRCLAGNIHEVEVGLLHHADAGWMS